jgi:ABC-type nitrate/sulfonate/bicarbonate transport system substrate-binding protein
MSHSIKYVYAALALLVGIVITPAHAQEHVTIAVPVMNATQSTLFIAADRGYFAEEGLIADFQPLSGGVSIPALIGGSLNFAGSPFSATIAIIKGMPLKVVYVNADKSADQLWSMDPKVKMLADLKGKVVAVASRGNSEEVNIRTVLATNGFPANFVGFTAMGVGQARLMAANSGAQQYLVLNPLEIQTLRQSGALAKGHLLFDFSKGFKTAVGGLVTTDSQLQDHRDSVIKTVRAVWKGSRYVRAFPKQALEMVQKRFPHYDAAALKVDFDSQLETLNSGGDLGPDAAKRELVTHAQVLGVPPDQIPPISKVYDFTVLNEIKKQLAAANWQPKP